MRRALIVVGKAPIAGSTKTRLVPPLSAPEAADLYRGFLRDTLELACALNWEVTSLVHPRGDGPVLAALVKDSAVQLLEQQADGLGDALAYAFQHHFAAGCGTAVLIGSDNPTLVRQPVEAACQALQQGADLAIGPTVDGGYYLIGMRRPHPGVFVGIDWSTPRVHGQTRSRARELGLRVDHVAEWYDVDEPVDLDRLSSELATAPPGVARHTRRVMEQLQLTTRRAPAASAARQTSQRTRV
ncbi:MAG: TIGR04282 family arsenosugar biosynthesis glycosyltransferase [Chloroflexi bacterium]|nr:TIGR04282 family arsenosugar biosynthesis glycosyltransferase [Chloroflexota bacterium]